MSAVAVQPVLDVKPVLVEDKKPLMSYIVIAVVVVIIIAALWYGYSQFTKNQKTQVKVKKDPERDEAIIDYNLRDEINELEKIQQNVLKNLSSDPGI
jgi:p-aminobenzoyl-glutamate transporter AbgT